MKNITIAGYLNYNSKLIKEGKCLSFSVGVRNYKGESTELLWFQCYYWGTENAVLTLSQYLKKGTFVCCTGDLDLREKEDGGYRLIINSKNVTFNNPKHHNNNYREEEDNKIKNEEDSFNDNNSNKTGILDAFGDEEDLFPF